MHGKFLYFLEHSMVSSVSTPCCDKPLTPLINASYITIYREVECARLLVMDNAHIHHGSEILELAKRFGMHIIILEDVFDTDSFCRCLHHFLASILSGSKPNWGGNIQDKGLDPLELWAVLSWWWNSLWCPSHDGCNNTQGCRRVFLSCRVPLCSEMSVLLIIVYSFHQWQYVIVQGSVCYIDNKNVQCSCFIASIVKASDP